MVTADPLALLDPLPAPAAVLLVLPPPALLLGLPPPAAVLDLFDVLLHALNTSAVIIEPAAIRIAQGRVNARICLSLRPLAVRCRSALRAVRSLRSTCSVTIRSDHRSTCCMGGDVKGYPLVMDVGATDDLSCQGAKPLAGPA